MPRHEKWLPLYRSLTKRCSDPMSKQTVSERFDVRSRLAVTAVGQQHGTGANNPAQLKNTTRILHAELVGGAG